jgi:hypothetical protein
MKKSILGVVLGLGLLLVTADAFAQAAKPSGGGKE